MMVHTSNPSIWEVEAEDCKFEASLGYRVSSTPVLDQKKKKIKTPIKNIQFIV
jgi:hypothetical protein